MQKFIIILCSLIALNAHSQNYKIEFLEKIDFSDGVFTKPLEKESTLLFNEDYSIFSSFVIERSVTREAYDKAGNNVRIIHSKDTIHAYKNQANKTVTIKKNLFTGKKIVLDSLDIMKWELLNEKKTILGYDCYKAKTKFRGVEFEVFYTPKIPISDGPYSFCGLPGVILSVKLIDPINTFEVEAYSITNSNSDIINPFTNSKVISFNEYKNIYKKKHQELGNYSGGENTLSKGWLENLIDE